MRLKRAFAKAMVEMPETAKLELSRYDTFNVACLCGQHVKTQFHSTFRNDLGSTEQKMLLVSCPDCHRIYQINWETTVCVANAGMAPSVTIKKITGRGDDGDS